MRTVKVTEGLLKGGGNLSLRIPTQFEGNTITDITSQTSCRELAIGYFAGIMCKQIPKTKPAKERYFKRLHRMTGKARIIFTGLPIIAKEDVLNPEKVDTILSTLHMVEEALGFPKTIMSRVKDGQPRLVKVMFTGHKKWLRSSHTMSLWALLIRLGLRRRDFRVTTWEALEKVLKTYSNKLVGGSNTTERDSYYARQTYKTWLPLMKNVDKIYPVTVPWNDRFRSAKMHTRKTGGAYTNSIGTEGIMLAASGKSQHIGMSILEEIMKGG